MLVLRVLEFLYNALPEKSRIRPTRINGGHLDHSCHCPHILEIENTIKEVIDLGTVSFATPLDALDSSRLIERSGYQGRG